MFENQTGVTAQSSAEPLVKFPLSLKNEIAFLQFKAHLKEINLTKCGLKIFF